jgi:hypothetical protein
MEDWKAVIGYDGLYEVSNFGNVRRIAPWCDGRRTKPAPKLAGKTTKNGYRRVSLRKDMVVHEYAIHRLVASAFIGNLPSPTHQVNHKNGRKTDNRPHNLEWVTPSANQLHSYRELGNPTRPGSKHHNAKLTESDVFQIRALYAQGVPQKTIAEKYSIGRPATCAICLRKAWRHI